MGWVEGKLTTVTRKTAGARLQSKQRAFSDERCRHGRILHERSQNFGIPRLRMLHVECRVQRKVTARLAVDAQALETGVNCTARPGAVSSITPKAPSEW